MSLDEEEARNLRHFIGIQVVPLSSGAWAVYSNGQVVPEGIWPSLLEAEEGIREASERQRQRAEATIAFLDEARRKHLAATGGGKQRIEATLEELGL